jgi:hypothetical protein
MFLSILFANISTEFLRHGRLLTKQELKDSIKKSWAPSLFFALIMLVFMRKVGMSSVGGHLLAFLGGIVRCAINTIRVKFFGHREYFPKEAGATYHR